MATEHLTGARRRAGAPLERNAPARHDALAPAAAGRPLDMSPRITAVLVSYRSGALAVRALESFRRDAERSGLSCEAVAVVNSGDPSEARVLAAAADRVVEPGANLGYAGGLNAGVAASRGDVLLLDNPDLLFLPGSVAALATAARRPGRHWPH